MGAQAQGADVRPRRPVLGGRLPPRSAGAGEPVDPGVRSRTIGRHRGRYGRTAAPPARRVRRPAAGALGCRRDARARDVVPAAPDGGPGVAAAARGSSTPTT
jgi:hypothetical protein